ATAALLAITAIYLVTSKYESALDDLSAQNALLRVKAQETRETLARSQAVYTEIANIRRLREETVSKVAVLEELTRLLPDTAYVTDLKVDGGTVDVSGLAKSAASLIPVIERSAFFFEATSTAPLTFDAQRDKERFSIRAHIRNVPVGGQSAQQG